jgi:transposase
MRAIHLANYFIAGCIAFSLLGWVASLHPIAFRAVLCLLAAIAIGWGLSWLLDFSLSKLLKISVADLQALLISGLAMLLIGLGRVFKLVVSWKIGDRKHLTLMNRGDLSNEQWQRLEPLLPPLKPRTGKPNRDHRQVVNGILWILRTGAPWRDLPERYGSWQSIATRFYRWQKANIWQQVLECLQADADQQGKLDWEIHYVDGSVIRAHQHAAGGKKGANHRRN